eukprot:6595725-Alexandrium_andersonii.AAC.1
MLPVARNPQGTGPKGEIPASSMQATDRAPKSGPEPRRRAHPTRHAATATATTQSSAPGPNEGP